MKRLQSICLIVFFYCSTLLGPSMVSGADFVVNSTFDVEDLNAGNGLCVAYLIISIPNVIAVCTLRAAVQEANALPGKDRILLPAGTYSIAEAGRGEDAGLTGDYDITDSLEIIGDSAGGTIIDGADLDRVLDILPPGVTVTLKNVSITGGLIGLDQAGESGGGIRNAGNLNLDSVLIEHNEVQGVGTKNNGGGIANSGRLFLLTSRVENNSAFEGGGITNLSSGTLQISSASVTRNRANRGGGLVNHGWAEMVNTTISTNSADFYSSAQAGGIYNTGSLTITQSTIAENSSPLGGGVVNLDTLSLRNTIIANNTDDCLIRVPISSLGHNLMGDTSCNLTAGQNDLVGKAPLLRPLSLNKNTTWSHSLFPWSPAIDQGATLENIHKDQAGDIRPKGRAYDIGSMESEGFSIVPLLVPCLFNESLE